jgi:hypothetical protein
MANPLIFDTFMGAKPQSPMEISENSDMDLDLEFPSNDLQLNAPYNPMPKQILRSSGAAICIALILPTRWNSLIR